MIRLPQSLLACLILCCTVLLIKSDVRANPSSSNPQALLEARNEPTSQKYWQRADDAVKLLYEYGTPMEALYRSGDIQSINPAEVGELYSATHEIMYCEGHLGRLGEPVHTQLRDIYQYYQALLNEIIAEYRKLPGTAQTIRESFEKKNSKATKAIIKESRKLKKVQGMAKKGEWEELDEAVHAVELQVLKYVCWVPGIPIGKTKIGPILSVRNQFREEIGDYFNSQADEILSVLRDAETPDLNGLINQLNSAVESLSGSGKVESAGTSLSGPEWLEGFKTVWEKELVKINRVRGIEASHWRTNPQSDVSIKALGANQEDFFNNVNEGIAKLIEADTSATPEEQIPEIYDAYLQVLTKFLNHHGDAELPQSILAALNNMADKSSTLSEDVPNYQIVTDDLMRWRKRKADAIVSSLQNEYTLLAEAAKGKSGIGKGRLHSRDDDDLDQKTTIKDQIASIQQELLDKKVIAVNCTYSPGHNRLLTPITLGIGAEISSISASPAMVNSFEDDLLVNENRGFYPLSLQAALAIYRTDRNDFYQVGGTITHFELQGRVTQLAESTSDDLPRENFSSMQETATLDASQLMAGRAFICRIEPKFIRNEYFLVFLE